MRVGVLGAARIASEVVSKPVECIDSVVITAVASRNFENAKKYAAENNVQKAVITREDASPGFAFAGAQNL